MNVTIGGVAVANSLSITWPNGDLTFCIVLDIVRAGANTLIAYYRLLANNANSTSDVLGGTHTATVTLTSILALASAFSGAGGATQTAIFADYKPAY